MFLALIRSAAIAVVLALAAPLALSANQNPTADPDARTLAAYRLSDAVLVRFVAASKRLAAAAPAPQDSADDAEDEEDEEDEDEESTETIAEMAAFYDRHQPYRQALAAAGMTSREYVTFMMALFQAGMAAWLVERHGWDRLPPEIARENVVFYQRHKTQLDSLSAALKERGEQDP